MGELVRTPEEAIDVIISNKPTSGYEMLREALDMAVGALIKESELAPFYDCCDLRGNKLEKKFMCPECESPLWQSDHYKYCPVCGNKIKWESEESMEVF